MEGVESSSALPANIRLERKQRKVANTPAYYDTELITAFLVFWFKRILDRGPEQRESKLTVLCQVIIIILISYVILYYFIIKLLIMQSHPSRNRKSYSG